MKLKHTISLAFCTIICSLSAQTAGTIVHNEAVLKVAIKSITPGSTVFLANGVWNAIEIVVKGNGSKAAPITLSVQELGKATLEGESNLRTAGSHIVVKDLIFRNGHTPTGEAISYKKDSENLSITIHGVQLAKMNNLTFKNSKKLNLFLAVGEPVISINNTTFGYSAGLTSNEDVFDKENLTTKNSNK